MGSINAYCGERRDADIYHETILKPAELFEAFDEWDNATREIEGSTLLGHHHLDEVRVLEGIESESGVERTSQGGNFGVGIVLEDIR